MEITQPQEEDRQVVKKTLIQNFRTAAEGFGKLCPVQNELLIKKGRNVRRLICEESQLRLMVADQPEVILYVSCDATVDELKQLFSTLGDD